jgi:Rrf2 family protein
MVDLALYGGDGPVPRADIAARQELSGDYLAQIFQDLQQAGLVRGVKGPGGGYLLVREPAEICVGEIVWAVEGPLALVDCVGPEGADTCELYDRCVTRHLWEKATEAISETLNGITLEDLRAQACELQNLTGDDGLRCA